jgi:hypothetical protein
MMRSVCFLSVAIAIALLEAGAAAQTLSSTASGSEYTPCPRGRLAIYFASGDTTASPQAEALIERVSEAAATCQPDGIDLIAHIDARVDGDSAVAVALARLNTVAGDLIAQGVPVERIRVAAQAGLSPAAPTLTQIDVLFRKSGDAPDDVAAEPVTIVRKIPGQSI